MRQPPEGTALRTGLFTSFETDGLATVAVLSRQPDDPWIVESFTGDALIRFIGRDLDGAVEVLAILTQGFRHPEVERVARVIESVRQGYTIIIPDSLDETRQTSFALFLGYGGDHPRASLMRDVRRTAPDGSLSEPEFEETGWGLNALAVASATWPEATLAALCQPDFVAPPPWLQIILVLDQCGTVHLRDDEDPNLLVTLTIAPAEIEHAQRSALSFVVEPGPETLPLNIFLSWDLGPLMGSPRECLGIGSD